jgi:hypothetical protein
VKALANRIRRIEERLAPAVGSDVCRAATILYERRRRRALAAGELFDQLPPVPPPRGVRALSVAETLRQRYLKRPE